MKKLWNILGLSVLAALLLTALSACTLLHEHSWIPASCTEPFHCEGCGDVVGEPLGHTWLPKSCTEPQLCSSCGATQGEVTAHTWIEASCNAPKTCSVCGETEGEARGHFWRNATCELPQTCDRCGETKGEPRGHMVNKASCTEASICSVCGQTRALALGHDWQAATCTSAKHCLRCGLNSGTPTDHKWVGKVVCGERRSCATCNALEAVADHKWGKDGCCTRCGTEIPIERIQQLVSFQTGNSTAQMQKTGEQVFIRHLWATSEAPFDITIRTEKITARIDDGYWSFPPYISTITPELGVKKSTIKNVYNHSDDKAVLTTPKTVKGSFLICIIIENSPIYYPYVNCSFELDIRIGEATYLVKVTDQGDTWTRTN